MKRDLFAIEQQLKFAIINSICSELLECPARVVTDCKRQIEVEYFEHLKKLKEKDSDVKSVENSE